MKKTGHIVVMLLFLALRAAGQDKHGDDVVVHSDPRLSILMKKKKAAVASLSKPVVRHPAATVATNTVTTGAVSVAAVPGIPLTARPGATTSAVNLPPGSTPAGTVPADPHTKPEPVVTIPKMPAPVYVREKEGRVVYAGKGFRVQIYNGPDREKAIQVKTEFMRNFPGIRTYVSYVSPGYRVKVGNYRSRAEAMGMYKEAKGIYGPCVIVPDMITINTH